MRRSPLYVGTAAFAVLLAASTAALRGPAPAATPVPVALTQPVVAQPGSTTTLQTGFSFEGEPRPVTIHVPPGLLAPAPLVVVLHAHAQQVDTIRAVTRLERLADRMGFVVAFPTGATGSWNAGTCCFPASGQGVDDVAYLDAVVRLVQQRAPIDPARIGLTGGSNGAMMALRYACERPQVVSAVAVVAGPYVASCTPTRPTPVLELHGELDRAVPLEGGANTPLGVTFPAVSASLEPFRRAGAPVEVRVVPGAGHEWMTLDRRGVDATTEVWDWLRDHPMLPG